MEHIGSAAYVYASLLGYKGDDFASCFVSSTLPCTSCDMAKLLLSDSVECKCILKQVPFNGFLVASEPSKKVIHSSGKKQNTPCFSYCSVVT